MIFSNASTSTSLTLRLRIFIVALFSLFSVLTHASVAPALVMQPALIPAPPQIAATSYILIDALSGKVIAEKNAHEKLPPASLTKMMTAYSAEYEIARGNISRSDNVLVSKKAWRTGGSKMFIKVGNRVPLKMLLQGIIVQSGNDASIAVAEHIAGTESAFVDIMNQHAKILGMKDTHFMNATGLPEQGHYSSAADLAILARAIITQFPAQYAIYSEKYFTWNNIRQPNRNRLLWWDKSVDGLKTGHTKEAGYCLVASAKRGGMRLISVVMGTKSDEARNRESQKLINYGFRYYKTYTLYKAGDQLTESPVWGGKTSRLGLGLAHSVIVTIPRGQKGKLKATLDVDKVIQAPIKSGQEYGRLKVTLNGKSLVDQPLIALHDINKAGFFKHIWDMIKLFFFNLFS